jgi:hypothetical protein
MRMFSNMIDAMDNEKIILSNSVVPRFQAVNKRPIDTGMVD